MKKTIITSIIATPVITLGILTIVSGFNQVKEDINVANTPEVVQPIQVVEETPPVSAPEAPQEAVVVETVTKPTIQETAVVEPVVEPVDEFAQFNETSRYIRTTIAEYSNERAVFSTFVRHQEVFFANKEAAVQKCLDFIQANPELRERMPYLFGTEVFTY